MTKLTFDIDTYIENETQRIWYITQYDSSKTDVIAWFINQTDAMNFLKAKEKHQREFQASIAKSIERYREVFKKLSEI